MARRSPRRSPTRGRRGDPARRLAFDALRAVHADDAYANLVLSKLLTERRLSAVDAAFATELLSGTCRWEGTYDTIVEAASGRPLTSLQPAVRDIVRLGTHQLLGMRVPSHAAVAATVDLAATAVGERVSGLTNAILRKVAHHSLAEWLEQLSVGLGTPDRVGLRTAHPRWVVEAYADVLEAVELEEALSANNLTAPTTLAVRPGLAEVADLVTAGASPGKLSPFAAHWRGNPADLPQVRHGTAGVQDEGSQLVAWGLTQPEAASGWWLDLCAGPGGKAALLTGLAIRQQSLVLASEVSAHRADLVASTLRAFAPLQTAEAASEAPGRIIVADATRPGWRPRSFTRVLADVPCSGLGALRRRPDARWRRGPADIEQLQPLQRALLHQALDAAADGAVVAYVTCSPHRRETTEVVRSVLAERSDATVLDARVVFGHTGVDVAAIGAARDDGFLQLWPHRHGTDAMFAAYLRRVASR